MQTNTNLPQAKGILYFTLLISVLMILTSATGIWHQEVYSLETHEWISQSIGQDIANLFFIIPLLILSALLVVKGNKRAKIVWTGIMLTNIYSFVIYCFGLHFNFLFLVYCAILGLSVYALFYFGQAHSQENFKEWFTRKVPAKSTSIFLIVIAGLFLTLWLSSDIPASLNNKAPEEIIKNGLPVNPVHVLDYSFYLPLMVISGILLLKKKSSGYFLASVMLVFSVCTNINIISLTVVGYYKGVVNDISVIVIFLILTLLSLFFLWRMLKGVVQTQGLRISNPD
ncbi:MAG: hypothetical protein IH595_02570 [Bacteroidales bacterium]|nr:hypothetical protein [Bacteroidales bacterium]